MMNCRSVFISNNELNLNGGAEDTEHIASVQDSESSVLADPPINISLTEQAGTAQCC